MKSKSQKQSEAALRQAEYDKLTPNQKLIALDKAGYVAVRQRAKLLSIIEKAVAA